MPESYFRDSGLGEEVLLSGVSDDEDDGSILGTDIVVDSSQQSTSVRDVVSPRAASNSRRKRRRKNSHNEVKARQNSLTRAAQLSPTERELPETSPSDPSPPDPASPVTVFPPNTPVASPGPHCTPKSSSLAEPKNSCTPVGKVAHLSPASLSQQPTCHSQEQKTVLPKRTPQSARTGPKTSSNGPDVDNNSKSKSAPDKKQAYAASDATKTPVNTLGKSSRKVKKRNNSARTRLVMKFDDVVEGPRTGWNDGDASVQAKVEPSSPTAGSTSKGAWTMFR